MSAVLGVSALYHDSAAAIVVDGRIRAAAQEERFSRVKHDNSMPIRAVEYCLKEAGVAPSDLDGVAFYEKPFLKFERLLETYLAFFPRGFSSFRQAMPLWLKQKLFLPREIDQLLSGRYSGPLYFPRHHESHAASAFFPSPFSEAAILGVDGVGEWATTSLGVGAGNQVKLTREISFPHSLGLLYSAFTYYLGFRVNSGEHKVMGLAPYGEPRYVDTIFEHLIDLKDDGSFWLEQCYFNYCAGLTMTGAKFHDLFGGPPRRPESPLTQRDMDLAASVQKVTEEVVLRIARSLQAETGMTNLCIAGGVGLNCVANGRLHREGPFRRIWVQPAAGDAGGALGAALFVWHQLLENERRPDSRSLAGASLGPSFTNTEIGARLDRLGGHYRVNEDDRALFAEVAAGLESGKVIGWFSGRMEFGPRALGNRSILADPRTPRMQSILNQKIKFRESFRPFAPAILEDRVAEYFCWEGASPYMMFVAPLAPGKCRPVTADLAGIPALERLQVDRSEIPAVTHVDYSARVQTVDRELNPRFWELLHEFDRLTGCPVLVNTSFNIRGEPIVCTPEEAYRCFMYTDMDVLVLEGILCHKTEQPPLAGADEYRRQFRLD